MDRLSADRAWRDPKMRARFERECGFAPLAESDPFRTEQINSGHVDRYHKEFAFWALRLGEDAAEAASTWAKLVRYRAAMRAQTEKQNANG